MAFTTINASQTDADSPLDQPLMDTVRTNLDDLDSRAVTNGDTHDHAGGDGNPIITASLADAAVTVDKIAFAYRQAWSPTYGSGDTMRSAEGSGGDSNMTPITIGGGSTAEAHDSVAPKLFISADALADAAHVQTAVTGGVAQSRHGWGAKATIYSDNAEIQDMNIMFGFAVNPDTVITDPTPDNDVAMLRYATETGDANWFGVTCDGTWAGGSQAQDTGIVVATATKYELEVNLTATSAIFTVNGTVITNTTKVPSVDANMEIFIGVESVNSTGSRRGFYLSQIELYRNKI